MGQENKTLQNILDNLSDGVIVHDAQGRIVYFNRAAESVTGHSKAEVLGSTCKETFGALCRDEHCFLCEEALNSTKHADFSCDILTKQGEQRRIQMSVTSMTDETGCVVGVLAARVVRRCSDKTERRLGLFTSFPHNSIRLHKRMGNHLHSLLKCKLNSSKDPGWYWLTN